MGKKERRKRRERRRGGIRIEMVRRIEMIIRSRKRRGGRKGRKRKNIKVRGVKIGGVNRVRKIKVIVIVDRVRRV